MAGAKAGRTRTDRGEEEEASDGHQSGRTLSASKSERIEPERALREGRKEGRIH